MQDIVDALQQWGISLESILITDIGAMACGGVDPWTRLVDSGHATLLGFEPQQEECARCNEQAGEGYVYLPEALGDGSTQIFHQCRFAPTSSFYKPNTDLVSQYRQLKELMEVIDTQSIATKRLDDIEEARKTDFLKLDVQGAELDILRHGTETLKHVDIVQVEVSFVPLYQDQPLFADVDIFLREQGFSFHTFLGFGAFELKPLAETDLSRPESKQLLWSDAVYIKRIERTSKSEHPTRLLKRAVLLHELYQSGDFVIRCLQDYDCLTGHSSFEACYSAMSKPAAA